MINTESFSSCDHYPVKTIPMTPRVGSFSKVSFEQFKSDMKDGLCSDLSEDDIKFLYDVLPLPTRATTGSAGYDFKSPVGFNIKPGESVKIPTGIKAHIAPGWFLGCVPRSGLGFKYEVRLANTFGVIDSDYFFSKNEGHIFVKLHNGDPNKQTVSICRGDGIFQAMFLPFGITNDDNVDGVRDGGFGSTGA